MLYGICVALSSGIAPQVVMKFTGHADYKFMKPYIDIAEKTKTDAMEKALNGYNIALKINIIYENITSECSAKL